MHPLPTTPTVSEERIPVAGTCAHCHAEATLHRYRLSDYRGWLLVTKCGRCLHTEQREPITAPSLTPPAA